MPDHLNDPLRWKTPQRILIPSMGDLFHPNIPDSYICSVLRVMVEAHQHRFMLLTKRPGRMTDMLCNKPIVEITSNIWLGVTVEDHASMWRADVLRSVKARHMQDRVKRWVSIEPLLAAFRWPLVGIDLIVVGGESGPGARPIPLDSVAWNIERARARKKLVFVKQMGRDWARNAKSCRGTGISVSPAQLGATNGENPEDWPRKFRVQELPHELRVETKGGAPR